MRTIYKLLVLVSLIPTVSITAQQTCGYIAPPVNHHKYSAPHLKTAEELPAKYDSRDYGYITVSRNQQIGGTCWAFATCDAVEALYNKLGNNDGYLSPQLLSNCHYGFLWTKTQGGNFEISTSILANLQSLAYEDSFPYDAYDEVCPEHTPDDFPAYVLGSYFLPANDMTAIKQCIMEFGAIGASMCYDNAYLIGDVYKYTGNDATNHAISLIGWDDDDRVFLAKFNWGPNYFKNGVLKISYDDKYIATECYAFTDRVEKTDVKNAYYYDRSGYTAQSEWSTGNKISALSYFTPKGKELLTYVGTYVGDNTPEITFTVMIDTEVPFVKTIKCPYKGFYSVKLDNPVMVDNTFIVAVDYANVLPLEMKSNNYNDPVFIPVGKQFIQVNEKKEIAVGSDSSDPNYRDVNLCIKAYTTDVTTEAEDTNEPANEPESVDVYNTDGRFIKNLKSKNDFLSKGLFIFVEHFNDKPQAKSYLEYRY